MLHIDIPTLSDFKALAAVRGDICVSIYLPTSPQARDARANRIAFKDAAKNALAQLAEARADKRRLESLEGRLNHLAGADETNVQDQDHIRKLQHQKPKEFDVFWKQPTHGLGVLATPDNLRAFRLPTSPKPRVEAADRYHLTPLVRAMTSPNNLLVLALAEESLRLIHVVANLPPAEVELTNLPKRAEQATRRPSVHVRAPRGRLQNLEGEKILLEQYARRVDEAVGAALGGSAAPLILAAAEPIASIFRSITHTANLVSDTALPDVAHLSDRQIADLALPVLDRLYERDLKDIIRRFNELKPNRATTDISYTAHAATAGAVETLLVDFDAVVPGLISETDGSVTYAVRDNAENYSVVDEIARRALSSDARVLGARRDELPDRAPAAAILRYDFGIIAA
jgi:Bacterial archaeo-eukaryotic release factor family 11